MRHPDPKQWIGKTITDLQIVKGVLAHGEGTCEALGVDGKVRSDGIAPLSRCTFGVVCSCRVVEDDRFS